MQIFDVQVKSLKVVDWLDNKVDIESYFGSTITKA